MKRKGPWKILGTRVVYKNPWIAVHEDRVIQPDEKKSIYGTIDFKSGSTIVAFDENNRVLLAHEYRYGSHRYSYEAVSGGREKGETFLAAAKRELAEEAGLVARKWQSFGYVELPTSIMNFHEYMFLACGLTKTKKSHEGTEVIRLRWFSLPKALAMVRDGLITHAATILLLHHAAALTQKKVRK